MLTVVAPGEAVDIILEHTQEPSCSEAVGLFDACGRVLAHDITAPEDLPAFTRSAVDGFAVRASDTFGCSEALPAMLEYKGKILMGQAVDGAIAPGECMEIPTGGMLPRGADAAVMVEHTEDIGDSFRYIQKPCAPNENIIRRGDDCAAGSIAARGGDVLSSRSIALLAALGISKVDVIKPPTVGIISTGDEIIDFDKTPCGSQVRNINSVMLFSALHELGVSAKAYPVIPDDKTLLLEAVKGAADECDCILISGGSSVGERDSVCEVLSSLGEIKFHGIAVKPGKPTMFAVLGKKPVFGLPGHPAAAFFAMHLFVKPALCKMLGKANKSIVIEARASQNIPSNHGRQETIAVKLEGGEATALPAKSGAVAVLSRADGYIIIGRNDEGILKGDKVKVILF